MHLLYRKCTTAIKLARQFGIRFLVDFLIKEWRYIIWKYHAERKMQQMNHHGLLLVETAIGFYMFVNPKDIGIGMELYRSHIHEPFATKLLPCMAKKGATVFECGANIGYYTLQLSQLVGDGGKVISVEPNPEAAKNLRLNLELNRVTNVEVYELALGAKEGTATFYIRDASNLSSMHSEQEEYTRRVTVRVERVDSLIKTVGSPIHLIRMDVEGYEDKIIQGAITTIEKYLPKIAIEYHKQKMGVEHAEKNLLELARLGYRIKFIFPRDEDWPWIKKQPPILHSVEIPEFLNSGMWKAEHYKTYTMFFEATAKCHK